MSSLDTKLNKPMISIGMPVYNNRKTIIKAIESILSQTFTDFELIISDNCSTDGTAEICKSYSEKDQRIDFIQQKENIGSDRNLEFVFNQSSGEFFMWAPGHYTRGSTFIESNLKILLENPRCSFSSSPNRMIGNENNSEQLVSFSLQGSMYERISKFLDHCWVSHACFYSLFRRTALEDYPDIYATYLGSDWVVALHLLSKGEFIRSEDSLMVVGMGASTQPDFLANSRTRPIHYLFPFYEFSIRAVKFFAISDELTWKQKTRLFSWLLQLNFSIALSSLRSTISRIIRVVYRKSH